MSNDDDDDAKKVVHISAAKVDAALAKEAKQWDIWDSDTHEQDPPQSGKFHFDYASNHEERVLIICGVAILTPDDTAIAPFTLKVGDMCSFWKGFACTWHVTKAMKKHYAFFDEDGDQAEPITCDNCGVNCWKESWFVEGKKGKEDQDFCTDCYTSTRPKLKNGEHQRKGETVVDKLPVVKKEQKEKKRPAPVQRGRQSNRARK